MVRLSYILYNIPRTLLIYNTLAHNLIEYSHNNIRHRVLYIYIDVIPMVYFNKRQEFEFNEQSVELFRVYSVSS